MKVYIYLTLLNKYLGNAIDTFKNLKKTVQNQAYSMTNILYGPLSVFLSVSHPIFLPLSPYLSSSLSISLSLSLCVSLCLCLI